MAKAHLWQKLKNDVFAPKKKKKKKGFFLLKSSISQT
jgi:hypothetical protein